MKMHNNLVIERYKCNDLECFVNWIYQRGDFVDQYIEIPANETISGHAEILDLEEYIHLFNFGGA